MTNQSLFHDTKVLDIIQLSDCEELKLFLDLNPSYLNTTKRFRSFSTKRFRKGTLLEVAICYRKYAICEVLLSYPDIDVETYTSLLYRPLALAAKKSCLDIMKLLIKHGCSLDYPKDIRTANPLWIATKKMQTSIVVFLLEAGFDVQVANIHYLCHKGNVALIKLLIKAGYDVSSDHMILNHAIAGGNLDTIRLVLKAGANPNTVIPGVKSTPLQAACSNKCMPVIKLLISAGADYLIKDANDQTLVHCACSSGFVELIDLLASLNVDLNTKDVYGKTPLIIAIFEDHDECAKVLVEKYNVTLDASTLPDCAPLGVACMWSLRNRIPKILLKYHANTETCSENGNTALNDAATSRWFDVVEAIITAPFPFGIQTMDDGISYLPNNRKH